MTRPAAAILAALVISSSTPHAAAQTAFGNRTQPAAEPETKPDSKPAAEPSSTPGPAAPAPAVPPHAEKLTGDPSLGARVPDLEKRLEALAPARAAAYFELGEEVAQEAVQPPDRKLARQLFALAVELNRLSAARDPQLERSAMLALAASAEGDADARWLRALAGTLDPLAGAAPAQRVAPPRDPAALDLCTLLSYARTGEGRRASPLLALPEVARLLNASDRLLGGGFPGGADRIKRAIDEWPSCPQCHNRRSVKDASGVHLCPRCSGTPGPTLSHAELLNQLRTEAAVLAGSQSSWAGQLIADAGAPLRELDVAEVAAIYGVSAMTPLYRSGRWVLDPSMTPPAPADKTAPTPAAAPARGSPPVEAPAATRGVSPR